MDTAPTGAISHNNSQLKKSDQREYVGKNTYHVIPLIPNVREGELVCRDRKQSVVAWGWGQRHRREGTAKRPSSLLRAMGMFVCIHSCVQALKLIKLCTLNMCILLYVNHNSIKLC